MLSQETVAAAQAQIEKMQDFAASMIAQSRSIDKALTQSGGQAVNSNLKLSVSASGAISEIEFAPSASNNSLAELSNSVMHAYREAVIQANQGNATALRDISPELADAVTDSVPAEVSEQREVSAPR